MQALVIAVHHPLKELYGCEVFQTGEPADALALLEREDIDRIVFDTRARSDADAALADLIGQLPVTTRLLAIVEHLPSSPICSDAGVVYLTPPVNEADIAWFLGISQKVLHTDRRSLDSHTPNTPTTEPR